MKNTQSRNYIYIVEALTLTLDELVFEDFNCRPKDWRKFNSYETIGTFVGSEAVEQAHKVAVDYLEAHFSGRWTLNQFDDDPNTIDTYQYGWIDNRTGLRPVTVVRKDVTRTKIV